MKRIAVVMGGYSSEKAISLKSGEVVLNNLDRSLYETYPVIIDKKQWNVNVEDQFFPVNKLDFSVHINGEHIKFDGVFIVVHGIPGENGELQSYFETLHIPYTSSGVNASAISFDKGKCNHFLMNKGITCAPSLKIHKDQTIELDQLIDTIKLPCFVKPNSYGSSFGISKVYQKSHLQAALHKAFELDSYVLIESYLDGTEVTCGVYNFQHSIQTLPITEIVSENDFFDYAAKYEGKSQEITPARISDDLSSKVSSITKEVYELLQLNGLARVDFIICNHQPHVIEVNTVPGLSKESIIPKQAQEAGISLQSLFNMAVKHMFY